MELSKYDFESICRVCKQKTDGMRSIFENDCPRIDEMLMACTTVVVDFRDGLPERLCKECTVQLRNAYKFKQLCEATDVCLRKYLNLKMVVKRAESIKQEFNHSLTETTPTNPIAGFEIHSAGELDIGVETDIKGEFEIDINAVTTSGDYIQLLENNQILATCRTCLKCFTTLDGLKCHKRLHTGSLFKCNKCGKQYTRHTHLLRHEQTHGRRKVHVCKICNKTLTRFEHLRRHLVTHLKEKPFNCTTCNRRFNRAENLANHTNRCKGDFVYACNICNKAFSRADSLEVHKCLHANKEPQLPTLENLDNIKDYYFDIEYDGPEDIPPPYSDDSDIDAEPLHDTNADCFVPQIDISESTEPKLNEMKLPQITDVCSLESVLGTSDTIYAELDSTELIEEKFKIAEEMKYCDDQQQYGSTASVESEYLPKKRIKRKRGRPRKNFGIKQTKLSGRTWGRPAKLKKKDQQVAVPYVKSEGAFICPEPECSEIFSTMSFLEKHALNHENIKLYTCKTCNKSFARANHLRRHSMSHSELKPFLCEFCNKRFNRRDHLMQHTKLHVNRDEYACDLCNKVFDRMNHLVKHKVSKHEAGEKVDGEKKYQCNVCLKSFTTEKYRDIHIKAHMGEKTHTCRICDKSFVSKSHLNEHVKFHSEHSKKFLCSECGQRFIRNDYLVIHMRRHRGEKPFKCQYCGKGFPRTTDLTVHERYHTGEKTHLCTVCGRGFGRAYNLTVHMRTHTGEKPYQCTYCDAAFAQGNDLKAHVRRHTGERFHCDYCTESFLMGYLLTHHKRTVHGLNIVSNISRLNPVKQHIETPVTVSLPVPVVPTSVFNVPFHNQFVVSQLLQDDK